MAETTQRGPYRRRSAAQWARLISEQASSGLSQREFCTRRELSYSSFNRWKRRTVVAGAGEDGGFVELTVERSREELRWDVELTLGEGVVLRIRHR